MKRNKGFTLIELLVVISIIAVLATLALVGVSGAQKQARDTTRRSDLMQYKIALENYYTTNNAYPLVAAGNLAANVAGSGTLFTSITTYMNGIALADPKVAGACDLTVATAFNYCYAGAVQSYVLMTKLESSGTCFVICGMANSISGGVTKMITCPAIGPTTGVATCP